MGPTALENTESPTVLVPSDVFLTYSLLNHLREELPGLKQISKSSKAIQSLHCSGKGWCVMLTVL